MGPTTTFRFNRYSRLGKPNSKAPTRNPDSLSLPFYRMHLAIAYPCCHLGSSNYLDSYRFQLSSAFASIHPIPQSSVVHCPDSIADNLHRSYHSRMLRHVMRSLTL